MIGRKRDSVSDRNSPFYRENSFFSTRRNRILLLSTLALLSIFIYTVTFFISTRSQLRLDRAIVLRKRKNAERNNAVSDNQTPTLTPSQSSSPTPTRRNTPTLKFNPSIPPPTPTITVPRARKSPTPSATPLANPLTSQFVYTKVMNVTCYSLSVANLIASSETAVSDISSENMETSLQNTEVWGDDEFIKEYISSMQDATDGIGFYASRYGTNITDLGTEKIQTIKTALYYIELLSNVLPYMAEIGQKFSVVATDVESPIGENFIRVLQGSTESENSFARILSIFDDVQIPSPLSPREQWDPAILIQKTPPVLNDTTIDKFAQYYYDLVIFAENVMGMSGTVSYFNDQIALAFLFDFDTTTFGTSDTYTSEPWTSDELSNDGLPFDDDEDGIPNNGRIPPLVAYQTMKELQTFLLRLEDTYTKLQSQVNMEPSLNYPSQGLACYFVQTVFSWLRRNLTFTTTILDAASNDIMNDNNRDLFIQLAEDMIDNIDSIVTLVNNGPNTNNLGQYGCNEFVENEFALDQLTDFCSF